MNENFEKVDLKKQQQQTTEKVGKIKELKYV